MPRPPKASAGVKIAADDLGETAKRELMDVAARWRSTVPFVAAQVLKASEGRYAELFEEARAQPAAQ